MLDRDPNHAKVLQQLGWLHHQQSNSFSSQEQAIEYLEKSVSADQSDAQSWYLLGRCYMSQQKYPKAYEAYQQAVYRDGRNPTFWCSIGVLYYQINQYRDALDAYSRAIRLNPYISEVWYDLGTLVSSCYIVVVMIRANESRSTSLVTTRSTMLWTRISAQPSSTPRMCISKLDYSYCATVKRTACHRTLLHPSLKMCIPTTTKHLVLLDRLDRNGEVRDTSRVRPKAHQPDLPLLMDGGSIVSPRSILHLNRDHQTHTSSVSPSVALHPHHGSPAPGMNNNRDLTRIRHVQHRLTEVLRLHVIIISLLRLILVQHMLSPYRPRLRLLLSSRAAQLSRSSV